MENLSCTRLSISPVRIEVCAGAFLLASVFYILALPNLPTGWLHASLLTHTSSLVLVLTCAFLSALVPPPTPQGGKTQFCAKCKRQVEIESVHCDDCRSCTSGFRLHCEWLNNCIGARNARSFAGLLIGVAITSGVEVIAEGWVAIVVLIGGTEGQSIAQVTTSQAYSLLDNGYLFKLTLLFTASICLTLCAGSVIQFWRHYGTKASKQAQITAVVSVLAADFSKNERERIENKKRRIRLMFAKFALPPIAESRAEKELESTDFTKDESRDISRP